MDGPSCVVLSTNQGEKFKIAHEPIKALGRQALMFFTEKGLEVLSVDHAGCILTRYVVQGEDIRRLGGKYKFNNRRTSEDGHPLPIPVAVDTTTMLQCLKYVNPGDIWTMMWTEETPDKLTMTCTNANGRTGKKRWYVNTINPNDISPEYSLFDRSKYSACIMFKSLLFHSIIRDLSTAETLLVTVSCDGERLVFSSEGILIKTQYEITNSATESTNAVKKEENNSKRSRSDLNGEDKPKGKKAILSLLSVDKRTEDHKGDPESDNEDEENADEEEEGVEKRRKYSRRRKNSTHSDTKDGMTGITGDNPIENVGNAIFDVRDHDPSAWPVISFFVLSFLQQINKARGYADMVKIYVKRNLNENGEPEDYPMLIVYDCVNFGSLEFLVGPRTATDEGDLPPYSERTMPTPITTDILPEIQVKVEKEHLPTKRQKTSSSPSPIQKIEGEFGETYMDEEDMDEILAEGDEEFEEEEEDDENDEHEDEEAIRDRITASGRTYKKAEI